MSRSVSAPSSVTNTSPCWNGFIVPGSTFRYGSSFCIVTRKPRALSSDPRLEAVSPLPKDEATPPVTKRCLVGQLLPAGVRSTEVHANTSPRACVESGTRRADGTHLAERVLGFGCTEQAARVRLAQQPGTCVGGGRERRRGRDDHHRDVAALRRNGGLAPQRGERGTDRVADRAADFGQAPPEECRECDDDVRRELRHADRYRAGLGNSVSALFAVP